MAKALFISSKELKTFTTINAGVSPQKYLSAVYLAQETHIHNLLGTDLYNKLSDDIESGSLSNVYKALLDDYIKPILLQYSLVEIVPRLHYQITSKGVIKHTTENGDSATTEEVNEMVERERSAAQFYADRFIDYMNNNTSTFPEYLSNSSGDLYPDNTSYYSGFVL